MKIYNIIPNQAKHVKGLLRAGKQGTRIATIARIEREASRIDTIQKTPENQERDLLK